LEEFGVQSVEYADLDGDGAVEALVTTMWSRLGLTAFQRMELNVMTRDRDCVVSSAGSLSTGAMCFDVKRAAGALTFTDGCEDVVTEHRLIGGVLKETKRAETRPRVPTESRKRRIGGRLGRSATAVGGCAARCYRRRMQRMFYHQFEIQMSNNLGQNRRYFFPSPEQIGKFCEETARWAAANGMRITSITPITTGVAVMAGPMQSGTSATCGVVVLCDPIWQPPPATG
jgi:hypothetical protein